MTPADDPDSETSRSDEFPSVTSDQEFRAALRGLLTEAYENGVDPTGAWPVTRDGGGPSWDVEIARLADRTTTRVDATDGAVGAIADAVADREGVGPTDLPPLQDAVDYEVIESVLASPGDVPPSHVTFRYCGYRLTLHADGRLVIYG
jgi:hypothetical protein